MPNQKDPWGHKITLHLYVEDGGTPVNQLALMAAKGAERELRETYEPTVDFIGASTETVQERPYDQGASDHTKADERSSKEGHDVH